MDHKATVAARTIQEVERDKVSDCAAQNWYKLLKEGDMSLEMKLRNGRTSVVNLGDLYQRNRDGSNYLHRQTERSYDRPRTVYGEPCISFRKLTRTLKVPHELHSK